MSSDKYPLAWRRKILFWNILVLLFFVFSLLSTEIILRLTYPEERIYGDYWERGAFKFSELTGSRHTPGFKGRAYRRGVFDIPVEISKIGLRQKNVELQLRYSKKVLVLGDSFTFGLGVREESTFASLIQKSLNHVGIGVINGGQGGFCITQEVKWGIQLDQKIKSQIIVLCAFLSNDIKDDYYQGYENVEVKYGYRLYKGRILPGSIFDFIRTHSYLWMYVAEKKSKLLRGSRNNEFEKVTTNKAEKVMQPTFKALKLLNEYCKNNGIRLGVVMIPSREGTTIFDFPFKTWLRAKSIPVLDLREKGFTMHDYYIGDGHWNEHGHRKCASYLVPFVNNLK